MTEGRSIQSTNPAEAHSQRLDSTVSSVFANTRSTLSEFRSLLNFVDSAGGNDLAQSLGPCLWGILHPEENQGTDQSRGPFALEKFRRAMRKHNYNEDFWQGKRLGGQPRYPPERKVLGVSVDETVFASKEGWKYGMYSTRFPHLSPFRFLYAGHVQPPLSLPDSTIEYQAAPDPVEIDRFLSTLLGPAGLPLGTTNLYMPLPDATWFRLLVIEPDEVGELLCCRLIPVPRESAAFHYEALSYTWGVWEPDIHVQDPGREHCRFVKCNGHYVALQYNLWEALHRLRLRDRRRVLWADALCINQQDDAERSIQVAVMSHIYSHAAKVLIWLGDHQESHEGQRPDQTAPGAIEKAFSVICRVVISWDDKLPASYEVYDQATASVRTCRPEPESAAEALKDRDWKLVEKLYGRSWFSRRWVIQEVACARAAEVFWGSCRIAWHWVGLCAAILRTQHLPYRKFHSLGIHGSYLIFRLSRPGTVDSLPFRRTFLHLLRLTADFESTDPLDQVFALLGLPAEDNRPAEEAFLKPDYTLTEPELCRLVAEKLMAGVGTNWPLQFLSDAENAWRRGSYRQDIHIPSWIPRWGRGRAQITMLSPWTLGDSFCPSLGLPFEGFTTCRDKCLGVRGIELTTIVWCSPLLIERPGTEEVQVQLLHELLSSGAFGQLSRGAECTRAFARTLCAGRNAYGSRVKDYGEALTRQFVAYMGLRAQQWPAVQQQQQQEQTSTTEDSIMFKRTSGSVCGKRVLFVTASGHLGLGTAHAKEGDVVCVLGGAGMPFILRRRRGDCDEAGDESDTGFELIGECYVDGIMEGEAVAAMKRGESLRGPFDAKLVVRKLYKFVQAGDYRAEIDALIDKAFELAMEKYSKPEAGQICIH